jgi:hypothetical protein
MGNVKGKLILRQAPTGEKLPKGKKLVTVVGVMLADEDVPDTHVIYVDGHFDAINPVELDKKFLAWEADTLISDFEWGIPQTESVRHKGFVDLAERALRMISHSEGTKEERLAISAELAEYKKELPELDTMNMVLGSICSVLTAK